MRASRGQHAALERDSAHLHRALVLNGRVHLIHMQTATDRRRQSHDQQTAGNYELVRDEDAESWRRSGSCPNKMSLAAAETFRLPSWFGLTTWSLAALREPGRKILPYITIAQLIQQTSESSWPPLEPEGAKAPAQHLLR